MPHNERHPNAQDTSDAQQRAADAEARSLINPSAMHGTTEPDARSQPDQHEWNQTVRDLKRTFADLEAHRTRSNTQPQ